MWRTLQGEASRSTHVWVNIDSPLLKEPFRDVAAIRIATTPVPQLARGYIIRLTQSEPPHLFFERTRFRSEWRGFARRK